LDVDAEVARVVELFAEFGGREVPWAVAMPDRGGDPVAERLRCWSGAPDANTVLYWVGHGWSDTRTASLAHARSPRAVAETGVTPAALAQHIAEREGAGSNGWAIVIVDACRSARFVELLNAEVDHRQGPRRLLLVGVSGEGATTLGRFTTILQMVLRGTFRADPEIELWELGVELKRNLPKSEIILKNIEWAVLRRPWPRRRRSTWSPRSKPSWPSCPKTSSDTSCPRPRGLSSVSCPGISRGVAPRAPGSPAGYVMVAAGCSW
jgi:hypothetical protein